MQAEMMVRAQENPYECPGIGAYMEQMGRVDAFAGD